MVPLGRGREEQGAGGDEVGDRTHTLVMMLQGQAGPMCAEQPSQYLGGCFFLRSGCVAGEHACEAPDSREAVSVSAQ